jgi:hypothetical protein
LKAVPKWNPEARLRRPILCVASDPGTGDFLISDP